MITKSFLRNLFIGLLVSAFIIPSLSLANPTGAVFTDVGEEHPYAKSIKHLKDTGVVEGYEAGDFRPYQTINRAEFLKVVMVTKGFALEETNGCFKDVSAQWFKTYVCNAERLGLVGGYPDGNFRASNEITFAEASKIIAETFKLPWNENHNDDWFHKYVVSLEGIAAIPTTIDSASKNINRGEMAEMIWRIDTENNVKETSTYDSIKKLYNISLESVDGGAVKWTIDGMTSQGVKLVWSKNEGPTYPTREGDKSKYYNTPGSATGEVIAFDGPGRYHVRVCNYTGDGCGTYSNEITADLFGDNTYRVTDVSSIKLTSEGDGKISWVINGKAEHGVKVVWSQNANPEYPTRKSDKYQYISDQDRTSTTLTPVNGSGTYFVRVCEYTGDGCGTYSNEIKIEL